MADVATTTDSTLTNATPTIASHPMHGMHGHHLPPVDLFALLKDYRTGNLFLDTLLCLLVPLAIQQLLAFLQGDGDIGSIRIVSIIYNWFFGKEEEEVIERTIEITQRFNRDGHKVWDWEQKNHLLQKAISLYLADVLDLENKNAKYELLEKRTKKVSDSASNDGASDTSDSSYYSDDEEDDDGGYCDVDYLCVDTLPLENTWITVEKGIQFMHEVVSPENPGDRKGVTETKVVFRFQSKLKDGSDRIEAFIDKAYTRYQEMEREKVYEDKSRYFYIQAGTSSSSTSAENTQQAVAFKRYALGEEKTFENLFFDEKEQVMQLLDNFANKTGKFAIKGFPYKLGFLLHGPPGTGKTSLIKAIAHYTKRHIVTINLGKMKSNQQLMDAMFDLKFTVPGLDSPVEYGFKDVIFVMEDIDCASSIVNKRDGDDDEETEDKPEASEKNEAGEKTEGEPESEEMTSKKNKKKDTKEMSDDEKLMSMMIKLVMEDDKKHAKINLAGLLNVLDGVIDCPGRIIIMTSNHPEKLDPALIRPGRVNKKLLLSYMNATQVQKMIEYYSMTELNDAHVERLNSIFDRAGKRVSPAEVEEMCAEYDSMEAVLDGLERIACCTPVL